MIYGYVVSSHTNVSKVYLQYILILKSYFMMKSVKHIFSIHLNHGSSANSRQPIS